MSDEASKLDRADAAPAEPGPLSAQEREAAGELEDTVFLFADDVAKGLARAQTLVQSFVDRNLSLPSLDQPRDASQWLQAGTSFAADAMLLWFQTTATVVERTTRMTADIINQTRDRLEEQRPRKAPKGAGPED